MANDHDSGPHARYELALQESLDASSERQAALEILGKAIDKLLPAHRSRGTLLEHAQQTAQALLDAFGLGEKPGAGYPLDPSVEDDLQSMACIVAGNSGSEHSEHDIAKAWRDAFDAHAQRAVGTAFARLAAVLDERSAARLARMMAIDCTYTSHARLSGERAAFLEVRDLLKPKLDALVLPKVDYGAPVEEIDGHSFTHEQVRALYAFARSFARPKDRS